MGFFAILLQSGLQFNDKKREKDAKNLNPRNFETDSTDAPPAKAFG
jgi:hypothetical protein